ncbi:MAG: hypothetical protein QY318_00960 [Candidatus Dojkabacteria bacterium]|nr:MAG: hypothetical protein QY318_00960 [Candidatus Dojkabacteria bacterium]
MARNEHVAIPSRADSPPSKESIAQAAKEGRPEYINAVIPAGIEAADKAAYEDLNIEGKAGMVGDPNNKQALQRAVTEFQRVAAEYTRPVDPNVPANYLELSPTASVMEADGTVLAAAQKKVDYLYEVNHTTGQRNIEKVAKIDAETLIKGDQLSAQLNEIAKAVYGAELVTKVAEHIDANIDTTSATFQGALETLNDTITLAYTRGGSSVSEKLKPANTDADVKKMLSDALLSVLVLNPEKARDIIDKLGKTGSTDIFNDFPGLREAFQNRVLKGVVDKLDRKYHYFSPHVRLTGPYAGTTRVDEATAEANIKELLDVVKGVPGKTAATMQIKYLQPTTGRSVPAPLKPLKTGSIVNLATTTSNAKEMVNASAQLTSKANPNNATRLSNYDRNNVIFKGLLIPPRTSDRSDKLAQSLALNIGFIASESPANFYDMLQLGVKAVLKEPNRATREANYRALEAKVSTLTLSTLTKDRFRDNKNEMSEFRSPVETYNGMVAKLVSEAKVLILADVVANKITPELRGLNVTTPPSPELLAFQRLITELTSPGQGVDGARLEQLSALMMGLTDNATRQAVADKLRAITTLEVVNSMAEQLAGADSGPNYDFYMLVLTREFGTDQNFMGLPTAGSPAELAKALRDRLYAGNTALTLNVPAGDPIHAYMQSLHPGVYTPITAVNIDAYGLTGNAASIAHELYGIIRRGLEGGVLMDLAGKSDVEKKQYLRDQFGIVDSVGGNQLNEALDRLNKVLAATSTEMTTLPEMIGYATKGVPAPEGTNYTNIVRAYEDYLRTGNGVHETLKNAEMLSAQKFIDAVQDQANATTGTAVGDVVTAQGLELSIEEQRAMVMKNYEDLGGKTGWKGFLAAAKMAVSKIARASIYMGGAWALTTAAATFAPPLGVGIAVGWTAWRIFQGFRQGRALFEAGKNIHGFENKQKWAFIAGAVAANAAVYAFLPYPITTFALTAAETIGLWGYNSHMMKKEHKALSDAHTAYETALQTKLNGLNLTVATDKELLIKVARALALPHDPANPDKAALLTAINDARTNYYANPGDTQVRQRIRQFSELMEAELTAEKATVAAASLEAKKINRVARENTMAWSVSSATTKLWVGSAATFSGLPVGISSISEWFEGIGGPNFEPAEQLNTNLEGQLDQRLESLGMSGETGSVVGVTQAADGQFYAVVDLDGDASTVDAMVQVNNVTSEEITELDFSGDEQMNFDAVSITNSRHTADGGLDVATISEQYSLKTGHNVAGISVMQAQDTPAGAGNISGFIVDDAASGQVSVTVEQADGTVAIYGEEYANQMYNVTFVSEDTTIGAPTVEFTDVVPTGSNSVALVYTSEVNGQDVVVAAINPVTGQPLDSYTDPVSGELVEPQYTLTMDSTGEITGGGEGAAVASQASYVLKPGDSAWVATSNMVQEIFGEKAVGQDTADIINEAQANGTLNELYAFFQENDHNARLAADQRSQMTAFQPDDEWNSAILGKLAPESMARIEERTGVDFVGISPDQPFSAAYGAPGGGSAGGGEEIEWSINMVLNPANPAQPVTGVPAVDPSQHVAVWFGNLQQPPEDTDSAWTNFWDRIFRRDEYAPQPQPIEETAATSSQATQPAQAEQGMGGGAVVAGEGQAVVTGTQATLTVPVQGTAVGATAAVTTGAISSGQVGTVTVGDTTVASLTLPPSTDHVSVTHRFFPNSDPAEYSAEQVVAVVPGDPDGNGEGVMIINDAGQQVFVAGDVTIHYENGQSDPVVSTYDLADRNLANGGPITSAILTGVNRAQDAFGDFVTGLTGSGEGPLYDMNGRTENVTIPESLYDEYTVEQADGTVLQYDAGKVVIVTEEGLTYQDETGQHFVQGNVYGYGTEAGKTIQTDFSNSETAVTVDAAGNAKFSARGYETGLLYDAPGMSQDFMLGAEYQQFEVRDDSGNVVQTVSRGEIARITPQGLWLANGVKVDGNVYGIVVEAGQTYSTDLTDPAQLFDAANPNQVNLQRVPVQ